MKKIIKDNSAFTLIEVMVALSILMVGILGLWKLTTYSFNISRFSNQQNIAFRQAFQVKRVIDKDTQPVDKCFSCSVDGYCEEISCSQASSTFLNLKIVSSTLQRTFQFRHDVGQTSNNSTPSISFPYQLITVKAGWGEDTTACFNNIDGCSNNVTLQKVKPVL